MFFDDPSDQPELPPGAPGTAKYEGPWFITQLVISGTIGIISFLVFSYSRTRWPLSYAPRTKLKGFSPHEAHAHQAFFAWILPTIRTSEFTVLQIVGLDAAVLLNFFKMSFYLFSVCSLFAITILMPINWQHNKESPPEKDEDDDWPDRYNPAMFASSYPLRYYAAPANDTNPDPWTSLITAANSYLSVHLIFTYLFTLLALYFIYKNYRRFIRSRQLFSLELVHSIPARTVMVTNLPPHLQGERPLAEYFENMGMSVESVTVCREVGSLKRLLDKRTRALLALEKAWAGYVGNPSSVEEYDPETSAVGPSTDGDAESGPPVPQRLVVPHRKRPTIRLGWFKAPVDALEHLEREFRKADELVKNRRRTGKYRATQSAFVTFEKMSSAQVAIQTAHAPSPFQCTTYPAPEPRDIVWTNMTPSQTSIRTRDYLVLASIGILFFTWLFPVTALAGLLSYEEIKKTMPWLGRLVEKNEKVQAIVQNSLPSMAMISLNALLPFALEGLTYLQGLRARSWIEYSLLKKYYLFLLVNVVFIFLLASTYWQLVRDLANEPGKIPEKLAHALLAGRAMNFFLSYAILQGLGIVPLQLLNLGIIIPRFVLRIFVTRTPRDFAELNAPPMINYGVVYPQAILMFTITILYSVVQPLIVIFGAIYFGMSYVVYKYKLLFVFYKPYESQGQAWPLTFIRLIWGVIIFLVFMIGTFLITSSLVLASLVTPLLIGTVVWTWYIDKAFKPLSKFVSLSSVYEVERGEETADVLRLRAGHPVTWSQSNLNKRRYAQNDDTLYVAPEDERTDYSQPPMANWYSGVLNTGKRRYGHPALNGVLPEPWLPLKKGQTLINIDRDLNHRNSRDANPAVVLTLRKRPSLLHRRSVVSPNRPAQADEGRLVDTSNPWDDSRAGPSTANHHETTSSPQRHRLSYDHASGVIMLPEDGWLSEDSGSEEEPGSPELIGRSQTEPIIGRNVVSSSPSRVSRYGTYFHHPERRRHAIPGAFPR